MNNNCLLAIVAYHQYIKIANILTILFYQLLQYVAYYVIVKLILFRETSLNGKKIIF